MLANIVFSTCLLLLSLSVSLTTELKVVDPELEIVKQWNVLDYDFPWSWPVNDKTLYDPERIVMTGVEVGHDRLFVMTPRLYAGVPATLSMISRENYEMSPVLRVRQVTKRHSEKINSYRRFAGIPRLDAPRSWLEKVQLL